MTLTPSASSTSPLALTASLERVIRASWPKGIDNHGPSGNAYNFDVKGAPFGYFRSQYHVGGIRLLRDILAFLYANGWAVLSGVQASRRYTDKDVIILRKMDAPPRNVEWLALAPMENDRLRVIYDPEGGQKAKAAPGDYDYMGMVVAAIKNILVEMGYFQKGQWEDDSFEFDLQGNPWRASGEECVKMNILLMKLLETMESHGWRLYTNLVQRTGSDEDRILDTLYFTRYRP
ncbi:hypothetical protein N0V88_001797 [Collariella sp. IMI 366227]|nr:hypothetical protein N0V88_001797 [Collariella sp. IMI 366227]